jgi:glycosyltransferase involved in cell wall biosynthesis
MLRRRAPRVSVVIATYDWSEALRLSLRSALGQTVRELEVIVVGDGCTDDSEQVVREARDRRARWIGLPENSGGQSVPNNAGVAAARAPWVAYLGHDDLWHPRHVERLLAAAEREAAEVAYSVAILYGPPGTGGRIVTGLEADGGLEPDEFLPPSSLAQRRDLVERLGGWRPHAELGLPADVDLQLRAREAGARFASSGAATAFKFPASWRRDAYRERRVDEQRELARRLASDPEAVEQELLTVLAAFRRDGPRSVRLPEPGAPGAYAAANRVFKGVEHGSRPGRLPREAACRFERHLPGFEWHGPEVDASGRTFQWSGPLTASSVDLAVDTTRPLELELRLLGAIAPDVLDGLALEANGVALAAARTADASGGWLLAAAVPPEACTARPGRLRVTVRTPRTVTPRDVDPASTDPRRLGVAVAWVLVRPAPGRESDHLLPSGPVRERYR